MFLVGNNLWYNQAVILGRRRLVRSGRGTSSVSRGPTVGRSTAVAGRRFDVAGLTAVAVGSHSMADRSALR